MFLSAVPPNEKLLIACMLASARCPCRHSPLFTVNQDGLETLEMKAIFEAMLQRRRARTFLLSRPASPQQLEPHYEQILMAIGFSESGMPEEHAAEQALACLKLLETKSLQSKMRGS